MTEPASKKKRTKRNVPELEDNFFSTHVAYSVIALANSITQNTLKNTLVDSSLSVNEWRILRLTFLYQSISAIDVIEIFGLDKTTTSRAITKLRDAKFIKMTPNKEDRRQTHFDLTAAGKRLHNKIIKRDNISDTSIENVLSTKEIASFHRTMKKLRTHVKNMIMQENE